jgi:glutamate-5-semialdehyde dehydrogenase
MRHRLLENQRKKDLIVLVVVKTLILSRNTRLLVVIVSGRGNNFVYVNKEADLDKALFIINGKTSIFRFAMP